MKNALLTTFALAGLCAAEPATGQSTAASAFHTGQWGIEALATGGGGGVLRFITPRTAIVFDVSGSHSQSENTNSGVIVGELTKRTYNALDVALGLRRHIMVAPQVALTYGLGGLIGTRQQRFEYANEDADSDYQSYAGGYAEIGGQFMVTNRFAAGMSYQLRLQRDVSSFADQSGNAISASFRPLRATLYF
jgi:hypothetical protein